MKQTKGTRQILTLWVLMGMFLASGSVSHAALTDGLVVYLDFEEGTGDTVTDTQGAVNDTFHFADPSVYFSTDTVLAGHGTGNYSVGMSTPVSGVVTSNNMTIDSDLTGNWSMFLWAKVNTTGNNRFVSKGDALDFDSDQDYMFDTSGGVPAARIFYNAVSNIGTPVTLANEWVHIGITYNSTSEKLVYFRNGTGTDSASGVTFTDSVSNDPLVFGGRESGGQYNGFMDNVALWNRILSQEEVLELYTTGVNLTPPPPAAVPPTVTINTPADLALLGSSPITVDITTTGENTNISVNGTINITSVGNGSTFIHLGSGVYLIEAATSNAEGTATDLITIEVDVTPPQLTVISPADSEAFSIPIIPFNISIAGELNLDQIVFNLNGTIITDGFNFTHETYFIREHQFSTPGIYTFNWTVNDTVGNSASTITRTLILDNVTPVMIITNPTSIDVYNQSVTDSAFFGTGFNFNVALLTFTFNHSNGTHVSNFSALGGIGVLELTLLADNVAVVHAADKGSLTNGTYIMSACVTDIGGLSDCEQVTYTYLFVPSIPSSDPFPEYSAFSSLVGVAAGLVLTIMILFGIVVAITGRFSR